MNDPKKRAERHKVKCNNGRVLATPGDLHEDMAARYEAAISRLYAMETKVKEVRGLDPSVSPALGTHPRRVLRGAPWTCPLPPKSQRQVWQSSCALAVSLSFELSAAADSI
ncbi:MAG TPA: hypothetical protein VMH22_00330 [bacterium]|nr:hypothetical protein [bacterium]